MSDRPEYTARLTSTPTEVEAAIVLSALEGNGIRAISSTVTSGLHAGAWGWVEVLVAEEDLPRAREVLEQVQRENAHIDWSQVDVGEAEEG